jgi:hypothetical protein
MTIKLDDILDFSVLSIALFLSMFIGDITSFLSQITYDVVSQTLSLLIQVCVLWGLIYKMRNFKKK